MKTILKNREFYQSASYRSIHYWIEKICGKPNYCVNCERIDKKRYEWANISGRYLKKEKDWRRLCSSCHRTMDGHNIKFQKKYYIKKVLTIIILIIIIWLATSPISAK